jgi:hypothetical protein
VDLSELSEALIQVSIETLKVQQLYCRHVLNVPAGGRAIVTNGRILGPLEETEKFTLDDFALLERFSLNSYGDKILQTLRKKTADGVDGNIYSELAIFRSQIFRFQDFFVHLLGSRIKFHINNVIYFYIFRFPGF